MTEKQFIRRDGKLFRRMQRLEDKIEQLKWKLEDLSNQRTSLSRNNWELLTPVRPGDTIQFFSGTIGEIKKIKGVIVFHNQLPPLTIYLEVVLDNGENRLMEAKPGKRWQFTTKKTLIQTITEPKGQFQSGGLTKREDNNE